MIDPGTWVEYLAYVVLFMVVPGPSHLLMMSNSMGSGFRRSYACAAGDLSANTLQILVTGLGLGLVAGHEKVLGAVQVLGLAYLAYSGLSMLYRGRSVRPAAERVKSRRVLYSQGFLTSIINPKALLFFAALFPQFIDPEAPVGSQLLILGLTYIVVDGSFLAFYGASAAAVAQRLGEHSKLVRFVPGAIMLLTVAVLAVRLLDSST